MPGFLYYVPDCQTKGQAEQVLREATADYVLERPRPDWLLCGRGPEGNGMMAIARGADASLRDPGYHPDHQTWRRAPGARHYVGMWSDAHPKPDDLIRERPLDGYPVKMGDDRPWVIPVARAYAADGSGVYVALPSSRRLNDSGLWEPGDVLPAYMELWKHVERHMDIFRRARAGDDVAIEEAGDYQQESRLIVCALAANYRLGAAEVSMLGLITSQVVAPVIEALIDRPALETLTSKKAPASDEASISPGAEA